MLREIYTKLDRPISPRLSPPPFVVSSNVKCVFQFIVSRDVVVLCCNVFSHAMCFSVSLCGGA